MGEGAIKSEPQEADEPRAMQKVPSLSDLSDPESSLGEFFLRITRFAHDFIA